MVWVFCFLLALDARRCRRVHTTCTRTRYTVSCTSHLGFTFWFTSCLFWFCLPTRFSCRFRTFGSHCLFWFTFPHGCYRCRYTRARFCLHLYLPATGSYTPWFAFYTLHTTPRTFHSIRFVRTLYTTRYRFHTHLPPHPTTKLLHQFAVYALHTVPHCRSCLPPSCRFTVFCRYLALRVCGSPDTHTTLDGSPAFRTPLRYRTRRGPAPPPFRFGFASHAATTFLYAPAHGLLLWTFTPHAPHLPPGFAHGLPVHPRLRFTVAVRLRFRLPRFGLRFGLLLVSRSHIFTGYVLYATHLSPPSRHTYASHRTHAYSPPRSHTIRFAPHSVSLRFRLLRLVQRLPHIALLPSSTYYLPYTAALFHLTWFTFTGPGSYTGSSVRFPHTRVYYCLVPGFHYTTTRLRYTRSFHVDQPLTRFPWDGSRLRFPSFFTRSLGTLVSFTSAGPRTHYHTYHRTYTYRCVLRSTARFPAPGHSPVYLTPHLHALHAWTPFCPLLFTWLAYTAFRSRTCGLDVHTHRLPAVSFHAPRLPRFTTRTYPPFTPARSHGSVSRVYHRRTHAYHHILPTLHLPTVTFTVGLVSHLFCLVTRSSRHPVRTFYVGFHSGSTLLDAYSSTRRLAFRFHGCGCPFTTPFPSVLPSTAGFVLHTFRTHTLAMVVVHDLRFSHTPQFTARYTHLRVYVCHHTPRISLRFTTVFVRYTFGTSRWFFLRTRLRPALITTLLPFRLLAGSHSAPRAFLLGSPAFARIRLLVTFPSCTFSLYAYRVYTAPFAALLSRRAHLYRFAARTAFHHFLSHTPPVSLLHRAGLPHCPRFHHTALRASRSPNSTFAGSTTTFSRTTTAAGSRFWDFTFLQFPPRTFSHHLHAFHRLVHGLPVTALVHYGLRWFLHHRTSGMPYAAGHGCHLHCLDTLVLVSPLPSYLAHAVRVYHWFLLPPLRDAWDHLTVPA